MRHELTVEELRVVYISIHAPLTGCDSHLKYKEISYEDISIHAPLTGCDVPPAELTGDEVKFQSTHP